MEDILYRTMNNIEFYIRNEQPQHALNEIGCLRGIIYAMEAERGKEIPWEMTQYLKKYFDLQNELIIEEYEEKENENNDNN